MWYFELNFLCFAELSQNFSLPCSKNISGSGRVSGGNIDNNYNFCVWVFSTFQSIAPDNSVEKIHLISLRPHYCPDQVLIFGLEATISVHWRISLLSWIQFFKGVLNLSLFDISHYEFLIHWFFSPVISTGPKTYCLLQPEIEFSLHWRILCRWATCLVWWKSLLICWKWVKGQKIAGRKES